MCIRDSSTTVRSAAIAGAFHQVFATWRGNLPTAFSPPAPIPADIRWLTPGRRLLHPLPMGWSSRGNPKVLLFLHFKNDPVMLACQGFSCPKCLKKQAQKCAPWRFTQKSRSHSDLTRLRAPRCEIAGGLHQTLLLMFALATLGIGR